ncbi:hypothetical protein [Endozoicomonas euniceicola]|uniref:Uncharacterized protein n=1 Tax=Endozoicomonas euniceicola TaxID=1234143 RepID=A0ABY6GQK8_9GAMM|nr:hypothetical protein [Endozoicomonas euniceicola]UYM15027.1 hypothetical protein NX720_19455 [Endozoicomonas euniceicola]
MKPLALRLLPAALLTTLIAFLSPLASSQDSDFQNPSLEQETEDDYMITDYEEVYDQGQEDMSFDEEENNEFPNDYNDEEEDDNREY